MFKYFILRKQQQLFCYFCGIVLAMVLMLLVPFRFSGGMGFICFYRLLRRSGQALPYIPVTSTG